MIQKFPSIAIIALALAMAVSAQGEWQRFSPANGRFSVSLPCTPRADPNQKPGNPVIFSCSSKEITYRVCYADLTPGFDRVRELQRNQSDFLNEFEDGGYQVLSERFLNSGPALEFSAWVRTANGNEGSVATRFFIDGNRIFGLTVVRPSEVTAPMEYARYLSSLSVVNDQSITARKF